MRLTSLPATEPPVRLPLPPARDHSPAVARQAESPGCPPGRRAAI